MGLNFSRSISFGLVRFNFRQKSIGVSFLIPGLGTGIALRGGYIQGRLGHFKYRLSIGSPGLNPPISTAQVRDNLPAVEDPNIFNTIDHEGKSVLELRASTGDALLQSMKEQIARSQLWPFAGSALLALFFMLLWGTAWSISLYLFIFSALVAITGWVFWRDQLGKLTVLFYEPDEASSKLFNQMCMGFEKAVGARKVHSISTTSHYRDTKYSAGAGQAVQLGNARLFLGHAPGVLANVRVPILNSGRTTLAFYPDRILAFQDKAIGSIDYSNLSASSADIRFVEDGVLPADATVVDKTWRFVNKNGGPDLRFNNNHEIPVCAYSQLILSTSDGLDIRFVGSRQGTFDKLVRALASLGAHGVAVPMSVDTSWAGRGSVLRATH